MGDESGRPAPYDLVFGVESIDDRLFPPIAEEAEAEDLPLHDPERFLFLSSVGRLLQAIAGGSGDAPEEQGIQGEALKQHGRLLYHAFHHWRGGRRTVSLEEAEVRALLDEPKPVGGWELTAPSPAGYLGLPANLVWAAPAEDLRPEPVDGFFWSLVREADPPALHVLLACGVREGRGGFSVVPATGLLDHESHWALADARPDGRDFESTLPGGEMDRLYSIETPAEVLKLASLAFWWLDTGRG